MNWQEIYGNWVLVPPRPTAIIHFLGGAFVATAPHVTYRALLESLAHRGYIVMATPFVNTLDHEAIAHRTLRNFNLALDYVLDEIVQKRYLPIYGVGHSMGCKLHLLIGSLFDQERSGNVLISFNNYPVRRAIPLVEQFSQLSSQFSKLTEQFLIPRFDIEFTPSPEETNRIISEQYQVKRNLLVKFKNDEIDQTRSLTDVLRPRFSNMTTLQILPGNHLTPLGQDIQWQAGSEFSPMDAIAQFVRQEVYRDFNQLKRVVLMWLDPLAE